MRIAIIGGHLTPALSVIEEAPKEDQVFYIGRKFALEGDKAESLEYKEIAKKGIPFYNIKTGRLQRSFTRRTIPSVLKTPKGLFEATRILIKIRPQVIIGFGGYVSFPVGIAAKMLKIPLVIHEQTQEAGLANKFLARFAKKVCISFDSSRKFFPKKKVVLTGNPIRKAIRTPGEKFRKNEDLPLILVTGGSLGSHAINLLVEGSLDKLLSRYIVVHQTGASEEFNDFQRLEALREKLPKEKKDRYLLLRFLSDQKMGAIMKASDLVVCRAGANTVSELLALGKKAYLIPLPYSQRNEQFKNATLLKKVGLGEIGDQNKLDATTFSMEIERMIKDSSYQLKQSELHLPKNAAKKILEVAYAAAKKSY